MFEKFGVSTYPSPQVPLIQIGIPSVNRKKTNIVKLILSYFVQNLKIHLKIGIFFINKEIKQNKKISFSKKKIVYNIF